MSEAIRTLRLQQPPATVERVGRNRNVLAWRIRCEECRWRSKVHPLISLGLAELHWHAEIHNYDTRMLLAEQRRAARAAATRGAA